MYSYKFLNVSFGNYNYSYSYLAYFPRYYIVYTVIIIRDYTGLLLTSLLLHVHALINQSMQIILEPDSIDKPLTFNVCLLYTTNFSYYCVHLLHIHAKVFSIQIFQYLRQIPPWVCTLVLFIVSCVCVCLSVCLYVCPHTLFWHYAQLKV